ncbi:MAG: YicC family protein [Opitutae bacterium]|nr:YicC family protein [Opitutae bacterium]
MKSMTGYGSSTFEVPSCPLFFEFTVQSVNRKNLDFQIHVPQEWSDLEPKISEWTKDQFVRGRIMIHLKINKKKQSHSGFNLNETLLDQSIKELGEFCSQRNIPLDLNPSLLIKLNQLLKDQEALPLWKDSESFIKDAFDEALSHWQEMRSTEGQSLKNDFEQRMHKLSQLIDTVESLAATATVDFSKKLIDRLSSMNLEIDLDDDRVLKEIALFSDRSDITEEITRLKSHISQFNQFIASPDSIGRKMDFLCVEMFREMNTISSKTQQIEVTKNIIDGKNELERIREQVQNIE